MKGVVNMSIHTEIEGPEKKYLEDLCDSRWDKMKNPCKDCKYRYPLNNDSRCCIFPSIPRDWAFLERD